MVLWKGFWSEYDLHTATNCVAYRDELHISGYAANQKEKRSSPTFVINKPVYKDLRFLVWDMSQ